MTIKVMVNGASGKMGQETAKSIQKENDFELVGLLNRQDDLAKAIKDGGAEIVIDFTNADSAYRNCLTIIEQGAHPIIGTTGFLPNEIQNLQELCSRKQLGGIIAPNFSIGAILLMRFAKEAARYFPHVEIIELHHNRKLDAPSGTAIKTAELISSARKPHPSTASSTENELIPGARGAVKDNIHIHSVRLPGLVAHEEVIFGDLGQTLTLRHDTFHREAFMPGVILACRKVRELKELIYGLENLAL